MNTACHFCGNPLPPGGLPFSAPGPHTVFRCSHCRPKLRQLADILNRLAPVNAKETDRGPRDRTDYQQR